jgi:hypothetical protein
VKYCLPRYSWRIVGKTCDRGSPMPYKRALRDSIKSGHPCSCAVPIALSFKAINSGGL